MSQEHTSGLVPEPPAVQVVISSPDAERIEGWITFFKTASKRVHIVRPVEERFKAFLDTAEANLRANKWIEYHVKIVDWPKPENIAFVVTIDVAPPGHSGKPVLNIENTYVFCLGKKAFGIRYFEWDGDGEANYDPQTYSLGQYPDDALSWDYVSSLIIDRIRGMEDRVPEPPSTSPQ
ncbi:MAG: hypothetical protein KBB54_03795 [Candidatus Pacebacteria bacterium]|nr:hypothetical protein [Candidatus Paceibacterota bacterium]MBP9818904.1 hypothetical protein [Candidatus Paceibacterota bacterium]